MANASGTSVSKDVGTLIIAGLFIIAGIVTLYDVSTYSDVDSKVFPRTVAIGLIVISSLVLLKSWLVPRTQNGFGQGDWWRRIVLVVTMLIACLLMPYLSFVPAVTVAFIGGLIAANHENWNARSIAIYGISAALVISGFYSLFRFALSVPLP
jgi:putative tricarboxylic transport membrane protein